MGSNAIKMQKNSKKYEEQITNIAKTQISEGIKSMAIIWILGFFISISLNNISTKTFLYE